MVTCKQLDRRPKNYSPQHAEVIEEVPTIWVTNHPESIPVSCLRRFSLVIELPNLPANGKLDMVSSCFKGLRLSKGFKEKLAHSEAATTALLENAATLCKICNVKGAVAEEYTNTYLIEVLKLTNEPLEASVYKPELEFNPAYCNLKGDLHSLADITKTIERHPEARILLFGHQELVIRLLLTMCARRTI